MAEITLVEVVLNEEQMDPNLRVDPDAVARLLQRSVEITVRGNEFLSRCGLSVRRAGGLMTAREAAKYLRVSIFTLSKMERAGGLVPYRTPGGHRRYSIKMLNEYLNNSRR